MAERVGLAFPIAARVSVAVAVAVVTDAGIDIGSSPRVARIGEAALVPAPRSSGVRSKFAVQAAQGAVTW